MAFIPTRTGLRVLRTGDDSDALSFLRSRRTGLLTNHTGRDEDGTPTLDALRELGCEVCALFAPEHGATGTQEGEVASGRTADDLPIHSLHGETLRPTDEMLDGLDVFLCDLQDVGARFYTYATTLAYVMEECARRNIAVVVLDRPNPLGGVLLEGPLLEEANRSFVGYLDAPIRHGLTMGELAFMHRAGQSLDLDLRVVKMQNWRRAMTWPDTQLQWPVPSPNLPDFNSAAWYPGLCLLEFSGVSVGRGTNAPFQIVGAPWLEPDRVLSAISSWPQEARGDLNAQPLEFTPTRSRWESTLCRGLRFTHENSAPSQPVAFGMALLSTLYQTHCEHFGEEALQSALKLLGSSKAMALLRAGDIQAALGLSRDECRKFDEYRQQFLLYS